MKLPQRWWLLGIDIQFDTYIDKPQMDYFRDVAKEIAEGDGIILCNAKPSWVDGGKPHSTAYATLDFFITKVLGKRQDQVRLMLAGDKHHYVRYSEIGGERALITCGGGGAYLSPTSLDPDGLELPPSTLDADVVDRPPPSRFRWESAFPTPQQSRRLALRVFYRLPGRNRRFTALMGALQMLASYALVSSVHLQNQGSGTIASTWAGIEPSRSLLEALRQPRAVLVALGLLAAMVVFSKQAGPKGWAIGFLHGLGHVASAVVATCMAAAPNLSGLPDAGAVLVRLVIAGAVGGVLATLVVATFLYLAGRFLDLHLNELFSAQSDEHWKSFLRLHIRDDGRLDVYPMAVERVATDWDVPPTGERGDPWIVPRTPIQVRLIEDPVPISRQGQAL